MTFPPSSLLYGLLFLLCSLFPAMSSSPSTHRPQGGHTLPTQAHTRSDPQGEHQPWKDDQHDAHPSDTLPPSTQLHNHTHAHQRARTHPFEILEREHYAKKHHISLLVPQVVANGTQILIDGEPFFIKGVCYSPAPIGESPVRSPLLTRDGYRYMYMTIYICVFVCLYITYGCS